VNETEVKYLAGLFDADGYVGFEFNSNKVYLRINLTAADSIDHSQYVYNLPETIGYGSSCKKERKNKNWSPVSVWVVGKEKDLNMLVPRLLKHLVIRGAHLQRMFDMWQQFKSRELSDLEIEQLKLFCKESRKASGSVKPKKHPTWAWVAGYLDGDGSFINKKPPSQRTPRLLVQATAHEYDKVGLDLLYKAFGGTLNNRGKAAPHVWDWKHSLGKSNKSFALRFLPKVVKHSKFKKHKIEQLISTIRLLGTCTD